MLINNSLNTVNSNSTIIVANNRQVIALKNTYKKNQNSDAYQMPKIFSWADFLINCYHKINNPQFLISKTMQFILFNNIINNYDITKQVLADYKLITEYKLKITKTNVSSEFYKWFEQYQQQLTKNNWLDNNQLTELVLQNPKCVAKELFFYGFNHWTKEQETFLINNNHTILEEKAKKPIQEKYVFETIDDELYDCARWAKENQNKLIAIISDDLEQIKHKSSLIFDDVFTCKHSFLESYEKPYNISLGTPLSQQVIIINLLDILQFSLNYARDNVDSELLKKVLLSTLIYKYDTEQMLRTTAISSKLMNKLVLTQNNVLEITFNCSIFRKIITNMSSKNDWEKLRTYQQWVNFINNILSIFAFAEQTIQSDTNSKALDKFQQILQELNSLQIIKQKLSGEDFLCLLHKLVEQTIFQTKSPKTNVHILGLLEAQGLSFDKVWIINFHQQTLPNNIKKPNFINYNYATEQKLPNITHQNCYENAKSLISNLEKTAPHIRLSYSKYHNQDIRLPCILINFDGAKNGKKETIHNNKEFIKISNNNAPAIQQKHIKGGVRVLTDQAQCQFKGFANRLNIKQEIKEEISFSSLEKGSIIHKVLELLTIQYPSKTALKSIKDNDIKSVINKVITPYKKQHNIKAIEKKRITNIVKNFIALELKRDDFVIEKIENKQTVNIANLKFDVKLDRMDIIADNKIIFDYKSSLKTKTLFKNIPLKEPQLPIYAMNNDIQAVAFICLTTLKVSYIGVGDNLPFTTPIELTVHKSIWKQELEQISKNFQEGIANVLPTKGACTYCDLQTLCRIG